MIRTNCTLALRISVFCLLMALTTGASPSGNLTGDNLSPDQIFKMARANYAKLSSYCDQGQLSIKVNGTSATNPFVIKLERPDCYEVEWWAKSDIPQLIPFNSLQAVWSSGAGGFLETGNGPQYAGPMNLALDEASAASGGVSITIPLVFFNSDSGSELNRSVYDEQEQPDENICSVDCYVFTREYQGMTRTLWIGKQDFLIHQVRTTISAEAMETATVRLTKGRPRTIAFLHEYVAVETHTNIILNKEIPRSKFAPLIQHFASDGEGN